MSLKTVLPTPINQVYDRDDEKSTVKGALFHFAKFLLANTNRFQ